MKPKFEPTEDGLEIIDRIERHRYRLTTHRSVSPKTVDTDQIQFPVDAAVEITADMITLPTSDLVYVRDKKGSMITEVRPAEQISLSNNEYTLDLSAPLKIYASVNSSVHIYSDSERTYIILDDSTLVTIGARSFHTQPADTITTTSKPQDIMQAVTAFGSALKTTTAERSYPTLRGHPPAIKLGNEVDIPDTLEQINTGIKIKIPPTLRNIFIISPLAYYLGAKVVSGSEPGIVTDRGYFYPISEGEFEESIAKILKHVFFLDCIVRTEGTTPLPLYERQVIESELKYNIKEIYNQPLSEQLETYLEISFAMIEPYIPDWELEIKLEANEDIIEFLPFISNSLPVIKVQDEKNDLTQFSQGQTKAIEEFVRGGSTDELRTVRSPDATPEIANKSSIPTVRQSWQSSSSEVNSTTPLSAFHNSIGRTPREDPIEIKVICNDQDMREELETVNGVYGTREELPFEVTFYYDLGIDDLKSVLASECDFLHYIGHIDNNGFQCADGELDASSIKSVGMKAFLLNACQSYDQGLHLINAGSVGGIVTLDDIINTGAISVGSTIARLLNRGYPLYASLDIARRKSIVGEQYRLVGDGMTTIAQSKMGGPSACLMDREKNETNIRIKTYITSRSGRGSMFTPYIDTIDRYYLNPGATESISVTQTQLKEYLQMEQIPVITKSGVQWSKNIVGDEL